MLTKEQIQELLEVLEPVKVWHKGSYNAWRHNGPGKDKLGYTEALDRLPNIIAELESALKG